MQAIRHTGKQVRQELQSCLGVHFFSRFALRLLLRLLRRMLLWRLLLRSSHTAGAEPKPKRK
jgi:hypothetical protein